MKIERTLVKEEISHNETNYIRETLNGNITWKAMTRPVYSRYVWTYHFATKLWTFYPESRLKLAQYGLSECPLEVEYQKLKTT
jgi:hypothetical protein